MGTAETRNTQQILNSNDDGDDGDDNDNGAVVSRASETKIWNRRSNSLTYFWSLHVSGLRE